MRQGLGRSPGQRNIYSLLVCECVSQTGSSRIPYYWDFMKTSSSTHEQLLPPFPAPLSSLEDGGGRGVGLKIPSF